MREFNMDNSEVLAIIPVGETISFSSMSGWDSVRYNNIDGWIELKDLEILTETTTFKTSSYNTVCTVTNQSGANLRKFNIEGSEVLTVIPFGETVEIKLMSPWEAVTYNNIRGWVALKEFKLSTMAEAIATAPPIATAPAVTMPAKQSSNTETFNDTKAVQENPANPTSQADETNYTPWIIAIVVGIIAIMILASYLKIAKCPKCKARKPQRLSSQQTKTERIYFTETEQIKEYKNNKGLWGEIAPRQSTWGQAPERIIKREYKVPGTRTWYNVKYKCQKCGEEFQRDEYVDKKD